MQGMAPKGIATQQTTKEYDPHTVLLTLISYSLGKHKAQCHHQFWCGSGTRCVGCAQFPAYRGVPPTEFVGSWVRGLRSVQVGPWTGGPRRHGSVQTVPGGVRVACAGGPSGTLVVRLPCSPNSSASRAHACTCLLCSRRAACGTALSGTILVWICVSSCSRFAFARM